MKSYKEAHYPYFPYEDVGEINFKIDKVET